MAASVRGPVDVNGVMLVAGGPGERAVDRDSGEVRIDRQRKQGYWMIPLVAFVPGDKMPQVWNVKVYTEPKGLQQNEPVKVTGLMFSEWTMDEGKGSRHGVSFKAEAVESLAARKAAAA
jgi:hypothetical protein